VPAALKTLTGGADEIFDATEVRPRLERMTAAWQSYRSGAPPRLREPMDTALESLGRADGRDVDAVAGDVSTLEWIRDRIVGSLDAVPVTEVDTHLTELLVNVQDEDLAAAIQTATSLREVIG
jgi:hypothetical protein